MQTQHMPPRPGRRPPTAGRRCSFCGKREQQVERMIASKNGVHICNECVALCNEIIAEGKAQDTAH
jgi:ATP-dependent Clp protease ATP-binding subunit ClpX